MRLSPALALAGALVLGATPVVGQQTTASDTVSPGAGHAAALTADTFVPMAVSSNTLEIQSSLLALERARQPAVLDFAKRMVDEHRTMAERFREVLRAADHPLPPEGGRLNDRHQQMLDSIADNQESFDAAYVKLQQQAHQEAISLFSAYAQSGDAPQLVTLAQESLPALKQHLMQVQELPGASVDATGSTTVDPAAIPRNDKGLGANTEPAPR